MTIARRSLFVLMVGAAGCGANEPARVRIELHLATAACDPAAAVCGVGHRALGLVAFAGSRVDPDSAMDPGDPFVYSDFETTGGARGVLELVAGAEPKARYREIFGGAVSFLGETVEQDVRIERLGDGILEGRFSFTALDARDSGGSAAGRERATRVITAGRVVPDPDTAEPAHTNRSEWEGSAVDPEPNGSSGSSPGVIVILPDPDPVPVPSPDPTPRPDPLPPPDPDSPPPATVESDSGCEGDTVDEPESSGGGGGCDDGTSSSGGCDDSSSSSGGGCDDGSSSGGGCDSGGSSGCDCEGDAVAGPLDGSTMRQSNGRRSGAARAAMIRLLWPVLVVSAFNRIARRRSGRRRFR